jgi:hypothetical protein
MSSCSLNDFGLGGEPTSPQQLADDEEFAKQILRDESGSDSDVDILKSQYNILDTHNKSINDRRESEYEKLKQESEILKREKEQEHKRYENIRHEKEQEQKRYENIRHEKEQEQKKYEQIKKEYDNNKYKVDLLHDNLYREKYDIDKERRLLNIGLNLIPSYSSINRNILEDKIESLVKKEVQKGSDTQKSEIELINLVKELIKKSEPRRRPPKKKSPKKKSSKKKSAKKKSAKKKSAKKSKKK